MLPTVPSYVRDLKHALGPEIFQPARARLAWLPVYLAVIAAAAVVIAARLVPWPVSILLSLLIGCAFAGMTFLGHEILHGAVVRGRRLRYLAGTIAYLPFTMSPRVWIAWHNRVHHGHTNEPGVDPDANPTLTQHARSRRVRFVTDHFTLGRRSWTGPIGLLVGFSVQTSKVLVAARAWRYLSPREHRLAIAETAGGVALWALVAFLVGPVPFLLIFFLPLLVANVIVMSFILTNHGLSPIHKSGDPLLNSLTVTTPPWISWLTLGFGFHAEHHLFPSMSSRHAPRVQALLRARWPERYQAMSLWRALVALHRTARVYKNDVTLVDPRSGHEWPTLAPRPAAVPASPPDRS
ncbi:fatty acid desaturase family protein [Chondromyces apiculatus]|uniref:Fatty acid desaturase n=1 Tax=Chondromyces apiculatus DSM 436 TaxID=1192034 RepID=A0A017T4Q9_9BACT|nr:fatty acid desaturase [Chondromyces apiculatus]EYF03805.1 Fatty acid desaturase [Chondromyces apiculatus DSM 436]